MRFTRKTVVALGVSGALTVLAGVSASVAVLDLPILGFGEAANETAAPQVVHKTVYDDHYVTATTAPKAAAPATAGTAPRGQAAPVTTAAAPAPTAAPAPAFQAAAVAPTPAPTLAPPAPVYDDDDDDAPPVTTGRPPIPAGCSEPEWDSEHSYWKCESEDDDD